MYIYICIHVSVYVCSMCVRKRMQYVYVCVYAYVNVSLPPCGWGVGGVTPDTRVGGREGETRGTE